jgi:Transcriptional regulator containing an amidase domain and an AraC-type DNA-binding HTH domain
MLAVVHTLHQSDFYQIRDFRCACMECSVSRQEQCEHFSICFVRSGYYEQHVFRHEQQMHIGRLLVSKPEIEYFIKHINNQPDLCTSFNFTNHFYELVKDQYAKESQWFFKNPDIQSLLLTSHAEIEFLHQRILTKVKQHASLELDELVIRLVEKVMHTMGNAPATAPLSETLKKHHLVTVQKARAYLFENFEKNISLQELADHCCVSLFHFSRIFKAILNASPHQYLTELRLNHAQLLLINTELPVTQIAFQSGFNSLEHFISAYRQRFQISPSLQRKKVAFTSRILAVDQRLG